METGLTRR